MNLSVPLFWNCGGSKNMSCYTAQTLHVASGWTACNGWWPQWAILLGTASMTHGSNLLIIPPGSFCFEGPLRTDFADSRSLPQNCWNHFNHTTAPFNHHSTTTDCTGVSRWCFNGWIGLNTCCKNPSVCGAVKNRLSMAVHCCPLTSSHISLQPTSTNHCLPSCEHIWLPSFTPCCTQWSWAPSARLPGHGPCGATGFTNFEQFKHV